MCWVEVDGKEIPWEEYDKIEQAKLDKKYRELAELKRRAYKLLENLGQAFTAVSQLFEDHPELGLKLDLKALTEGSGDTKVYELLKQRLGLADESPRCMHVKDDGIRCGSPRMKDGELCFAHQRMAQAQTLQQRLGNIEDANGIQMAISEVTRALVADKVTDKKARLLLYGLRTASLNVKHVTFHKSPKQMVTEETPVSARESGDRVMGRSVDRNSGKAEALPRTDAAQEPVPMLSAADWLSWETMDQDLKLQFMELDAEANRRWLDKKKAAGSVKELEAEVVA